MTVEAGPVVVGVDTRPGDHQALLTFAAQEANQRGVGIRLVHGCAADWAVGAITPVLPPEEREQQARRRLQTAAEELKALLEPDTPIEIVVRPGTGTALLLEESQGAALVVVQRRDISRAGHLSTGSTTSSLAARAACTVAVVKAGHVPGAGGGVVVGVDGAGHAQHAVEVAFQEASLRRTSLTSVHVWSSQDALMGYGWVAITPEKIEEQRQKALLSLSEALAGFASAYPDVVLRRRLVDSTVTEALLLEAQDAELLVVGRHGKTRVGSLALGGVARACLESAPCPVLVAPYSRPARRDSWLTREVEAGPYF